jgi:hypothetical protein
MNSGKFSIQCTCLVLFALFTVTFGNILPAPAEHVPCLGKRLLTLHNDVATYSYSVLSIIQVRIQLVDYPHTIL